MAKPPRATLRLQLNRDFTFADVERHVPYFAALGISHIYTSPLLTARPGSVHGYDIVDHGTINPELGGRAGLDRLSAALRRHGLGFIVDIVPNHMGVGGSDNAWWLDILEWGQHSPFARYFDIDWEPPEPDLRGKLLVPILGAPYGEALYGGELALRFDAASGTFSVWYHDHRLPLSPRHYARLLIDAMDRDPARQALVSLAERFATSGPVTPTRRAAQRQAASAAKADLAEAVAADPDLRRAVERSAERVNGSPGDPASFEKLHDLLECQAYRLASWRVAADEVNYRRFFDINSLAGLRIEDVELFDICHRLIFDLMAEGIIDGLRIDHIDGLLDPAGYCRRLQDEARRRGLSTPIYVVVEKILSAHERLRGDWTVSGTTGYDFMAQVGGLLVEPKGASRIASFYATFTGAAANYDANAVAARRQIAAGNLSAELTVLAGALRRLAKSSPHTRDFTLHALRLALIDIVSFFPVYRTYVDAAGVSDEDLRDVRWAFGRARKATALVDRSVFDFVEAVLTADLERLPGQGWRRRDILPVARKFQQFTGPVAAKSEEDTAFYRYVPLVSLNEVGSSPARPGLSVAAFHHACQTRREGHPLAMLATASHDHKRGEDVRARLHVLSEAPLDWARAVRRWMRLNRQKRGEFDGDPAPARSDEYLLYQTVVGAWPLTLTAADESGMAAFAGRVSEYMIKAVREAKLRSNWSMPNSGYEAKVTDFAQVLLDARRSFGFLADIGRFVADIEVAGALNGLVQTGLRLTVPGVPDTYQGTEVWDFSLVDPDNRREVPFAALADLLRQGESTSLPDLLADWRSGAVKQAIIALLLGLRRRYPKLFAEGTYQTLPTTGQHAGHVLAFRRSHDGTDMVVLVPVQARLLLGMAEHPIVAGAAWQDTSVVLPTENGPFADVLTGRAVTTEADGSLRIGLALKDFPLAVLCNAAT